MLKYYSKAYKSDFFIEQHSNRMLIVYAPFGMINEFRAMIGYRFDKVKKGYIISDCPRNILQIKILIGENPFEVYDKDLLEINPSRDCLLPKQLEMFRHIITRRQCIIAGDMGTGKTLAAIEAMEYFYNEGINDWWYIAPKAACNPFAGIPAELRKWKSKINPRLMTPEACKKLVTDPATALTISLPKGIIIDEASKFKNHSSQRTQAIQGVVDQMREKYDNPVIVEMTGTPAPKDPTDWWSLCEIACPGILREGQVQKLKFRLANIEMRQGISGEYPHLVSWKEDEVKKLYRRMKGLVLRVRIEDCIKLPPSEEVNLYIKPNKEILRVAKAISNGTETTLVKLQKLRQLSDGFQYENKKDDAGQTTETLTHWGGSPKMDALTDCLDELENRCVIFAGYTAAVDKITEHCVNLGWNVIRIDGRGWTGLEANTGKVNSKFTEEYFQAKNENKDSSDYGNLINDEPIVVVAHPKSGGMSLNFTASNRIIRYSCDFDGEAHMQSAKRIDRIGQTRPTKTINFIHLPSDELILNNLNLKKQLQALSLNDIEKLFLEPETNSNNSSLKEVTNG